MIHALASAARAAPDASDATDDVGVRGATGGFSTTGAHPGRRLLVAVTAATLVFGSLASWLALRSYRDARHAAVDAVIAEAAAGAADASQFLRTRLQLLDAVAAASASRAPSAEDMAAALARLPRADLGFTGGLALFGADDAVVVGTGGGVGTSAEGELRAALDAVRDDGVARVWPRPARTAMFDADEVVLLVVPAGIDGASVLVGAIGLPWLDAIVDSRPYGAAERNLVSEDGVLLAGALVSGTARPIDSPTVRQAARDARARMMAGDRIVAGVLPGDRGVDGTSGSIATYGLVSASGWILVHEYPAGVLLRGERDALALRLATVAGVAIVVLGLAGFAGHRIDVLAGARARAHAEALGASIRFRRQLLRPLPNIDRLELSAEYRPGTGPLEVGGDWYDVVELPSGLVALVVGDVVGRGVDAAALMAQLHSATRALAVVGDGPSFVLDHLDDLVDDLPDALGSTLCYVVICPVTGAAEFASAGHLPPLVVGPRGSRLLDGGRSTPLGVRTDRGTGSVTLATDETLVLYTDGLVERRGEPLDIALHRLGVVAGSLAPGRHLARRLCSTLLDRDSVDDDVCVLTVRVRRID